MALQVSRSVWIFVDGRAGAVGGPPGNRSSKPELPPAPFASDVSIGRATTTPICSDSSHPAQNREFDVPKTMRRSRRPHAATDCLAHFALDRALSHPNRPISPYWIQHPDEVGRRRERCEK